MAICTSSVIPVSSKPVSEKERLQSPCPSPFPFTYMLESTDLFSLFSTTVTLLLPVSFMLSATDHFPYREWLRLPLFSVRGIVCLFIILMCQKSDEPDVLYA